MAALHLLLLLLLFGCAAAADVSALLEFKKGILDQSQSPVLGSWSPPETPDAGGGGEACPTGWRGVVCDGGAVVGLTLDGLGLAGELKLNTLAGMRALQNLSLAGNALSGRLPPAIGYLASLRHLDLSGNRFYGPIPGRLADLAGLVHLNLSYNNFSWGFPTDGIREIRTSTLASHTVCSPLLRLPRHLLHKQVLHPPDGAAAAPGAVALPQVYADQFAVAAHTTAPAQPMAVAANAAVAAVAGLQDDGGKGDSPSVAEHIC